MQKQSAFLLVLAAAVLLAVGIVMLFSTGAYAPDSHGDEFNFLRKQSFWLGVGLCGAFICAFVDYHWWRKTWPIWLGLAILLLVLCFVHPIGLRLNGSSRWVRAGSFTFQSSELAKLAAVIFIAWWFDRFESESRTLIKGVLIPFSVVGVLLALIAAETDLGTTVLIGLTVLIMMFVAGASLRWLGLLVCSGFAGLGVLAMRISEPLQIGGVADRDCDEPICKAHSSSPSVLISVAGATRSSALSMISRSTVGTGGSG